MQKDYLAVIERKTEHSRMIMIPFRASAVNSCEGEEIIDAFVSEPGTKFAFYHAKMSVEEIVSDFNAYLDK